MKYTIERVQVAFVDTDLYETIGDETEEEKIKGIAHELSGLDFDTLDLSWELTPSI